MSTFKKAKVVMLPTNQKTKYLIVYSDVEKTKGKLILNGLKNDEYKEHQHFYIISDDEIKENNTHFYNPHSGQLHISGNHTDYIAINKNGCKKIIATTDVSLGLPQPSKQFIQKYIEEYNKGRIIEDILVEYDCDHNQIPIKVIDVLKVNPKDNTITIKKVKDSWTREEHISNIKKFSLELGSKIHCFLKEDGTLSVSIQDVNKWIEENL